MRQSRIERLQQMPIFGGLQSEVLRDLLDGSRARTVPAGQYFFREGDAADSMFVLESGSVELLKSRAGREHFLGHLREGDCFGEMALLDLFPRSASVRALQDCVALELSLAGFMRIAEMHLDQFALLYMNIARELSRRLRAADDHLFHSGGGEDQELAGRLWSI